MKIYLSPSTQERNIGKSNFGTEEKRMNQLCDIIEPRLKEHGFTLKRNKPSMTLNEVIADSNKWKPDIHVAEHSNAGGGKGLEIWCFNKGGKGEKLAKALYAELSPLTPWGDRGVKYSGNSLGETSKTKAPAVIVEIDFHDNKESADWIVKNMDRIAEGYVKGICKYVGVPYKAQVTKQPEKKLDKGEFWVVQAGAYKTEVEAKEQAAKLTKAGFDTYTYIKQA